VTPTGQALVHVARQQELLGIATKAARDAGAIIMQGYRKHPVATTKGAIDFVTEFDLRSEALLLDRLNGHGVRVVAEESAALQVEAATAKEGLTFYVDPLDGTTNFLHGHPFFCVSIGLMDGGQPVLGVVFAPALGILWSGLAHGSCKRNDEPMQVSATARLDQALLATGFPYDRRTNADNNLVEFNRIKMLTRGVRRCGSAAIDLALVADGTYDAYWEKRLKPWDLAAGAALVLGAGGQLSGLAGQPQDLRTGDLLASNGQVHAELVAALTVTT
jgi:myo-inositol-1(or 4)-monophosphatase